MKVANDTKEPFTLLSPRKWAAGAAALLLSASLMAGCAAPPAGTTGTDAGVGTSTPEMEATEVMEAEETGTPEAEDVGETDDMTDTEGIGETDDMTDTEGIGDTDDMTDTEGIGDTDDMTDTEGAGDDDMTGTPEAEEEGADAEGTPEGTGTPSS